MMKKYVIFAAAAGMSSMMMVTGAFGAPKGTGKETLKIEITTERLDDVLSVTPLNEAAKKFLSDYKIKDDDLDDVIEELADKMIAEGYLGKKQGNNIRITVKDDRLTKEEKDRAAKLIETYLDERHLDARIAADRITVEDKLKRKAEEYKISAGKMYVIHEIRNKNDRLSEKEMASMDMKDLMRLADENDIDFDALDDIYDDFDDDWFDDDRDDDDRDDDDRDDDDRYDDDRYDDDRDDDDRYDDDRYDDDRDDDDRYDDDRDDDDRDDDDRDDDDHDDDRYDDDRDDDHDDDDHDDDRYDDDHDRDDD
ncbi:hypothetical protein GPL15_08595 [Clostridium sp. MCC353]|uniref:anti-sigma-I factor RsgI family protein n=1 Tax=Clostridium sp. MCC353 TaxID=2592646 RepID=UPI001C029393|nr:hypothetical protein [Clostridium sp. MCC353]MBT9776561.1 hypothetical protein [Clostridium sp. MCC353]